MAKRQERLHGAAVIEGRANSLIGLKVTLIMKTKAAFFVKFLGVEKGMLKIENMRLQKQSMNLSEVEEIIIDKTVD